MLILVIDTRKIYINTDTTPKESKVVYVQLGSSLTQVEIGLTQVEIGLTQVEIGLTRVEIGLTRVEIGLTRVELRLTRVGHVANWSILTILTLLTRY